MRRRAARALRLATVLGAPALVCACWVGALWSDERLPSPSSLAEGKVIFPPSNAVLMVGTFYVIVKGGEGDLFVDGQRQSWEAFAPPLRVAKVGLYPGLHEIRVGRRTIRFSVALNEEEFEGPRDWPIYRLHTISAHEQCGACHVVGRSGDGLTSLEGLRGPSACFACHRRTDFEARHSHPFSPLEHCQNCHALHGSPRKSLLKAEPKKLCAECHDT